jgi:hypothetical protein
VNSNELISSDAESGKDERGSDASRRTIPYKKWDVGSCGIAYRKMCNRMEVDQWDKVQGRWLS